MNENMFYYFTTGRLIYLLKNVHECIKGVGEDMAVLLIWVVLSTTFPN